MIFRKNTALRKVYNNPWYSWGFLSHCAPHLRDDEEVVFAAVERDARNFAYASKRLRGSREFVLSLLESIDYFSYSSVKFLLKHSKDFSGDRSVIFAAVKRSGQALELASEKLKRDRDIVLTAVGSYGDALKYVPKDVDFYEEAVLLALKESPETYDNVPEELKQNRSFLIKAIKQSEKSFRLVSKILYKNPKLYKYLPESYFEEKRYGELQTIDESVKNSLKDRVIGRELTKKDETYALDVLKIVAETKKNMLARIKARNEKPNSKEARRKAYNQEIENAFPTPTKEEKSR